MTKNVFIAILVGLVIVFAALYFFGKTESVPEVVEKYRAADSVLKQENAKLVIQNDSLLQIIKTALQLKDSVRTVYKNIPTKYDEIRYSVRALPADSQLRLLSEWLSQTDSFGR